MFKCQVCGKSTTTSQGLAGHRWLKHGERTGQGVLVQGAAAQQAQAAQSQGLGSPAMVQVTASYLAQLQQQAQQAQLAQPQQGQALVSADGVGDTEESTWKTVRIDPIVEAYFDYIREKGYDNDLSALITECVQELFHNRGIRLRLFTPV